MKHEARARDHCYDNPTTSTPPSIAPLDTLGPVTPDLAAQHRGAATVCRGAIGDTPAARRDDALRLLDVLGIPNPRPVAGGEA